MNGGGENMAKAEPNRVVSSREERVRGVTATGKEADSYQIRTFKESKRIVERSMRKPGWYTRRGLRQA